MPKGIFFFVGPTGVGKTELSKALAQFLFGDEQACIRFDMSEYSQENSDQKLIGAAPGYVGYEEGGQLTNAVKEKPFSVILFDEIEKAAKPNPRILDIFLQILEDGRLTDSKGETVYFSDCIIIFTSNLGASQVTPSDDKEQTAKEFIDIVKNYFDNEIKRPEILGRIGYSNIVPFNFIQNREFVVKIANSKLTPIQKGIQEKYRLDLVFEDKMKFIDYIVEKVDTTKGGRDILNAINDHLLDPLAMFMFENKDNLSYYKNGKIMVYANKNGVTFDFSFD
jgi:ATP-dependent Clp protease ATP-binding subunit ClpA